VRRVVCAAMGLTTPAPLNSARILSVETPLDAARILDAIEMESPTGHRRIHGRSSRSGFKAC
jgi:hypothetical protein